MYRVKHKVVYKNLLGLYCSLSVKLGTLDEMLGDVHTRRSEVKQVKRKEPNCTLLNKSLHLFES